MFNYLQIQLKKTKNNTFRPIKCGNLEGEKKKRERKI